MKRLWLAVAIVLLAVSTAAAQTTPPQNSAAQDQTQVMGRGRGGAPFAWNDLNRDGICDVTGQPVGQRPVGYGRGNRGARGGRWAVAQPVAGSQTGAQPAAGVVRGRGRGGAPWAWNDRNQDGICDVTGQAIGQGVPAGAGQGMGRGRGGWRR